MAKQQENSWKRFDIDTLEKVKALGGQFARAQLMVTPGGETLVSQWDIGIFLMQTHFRFANINPEEKLITTASVRGEIIYLPNLLEGSTGCTYQAGEEIVAHLPKVGGLRWIIGNAATVSRVLRHHLKESGDTQFLLRNYYTLTTDSYDSEGIGLVHLTVGGYTIAGIDVDALRDEHSSPIVGLLGIGVPV